MLKLLKLLRLIKSQGFITQAQKKEVEIGVSELSKEEQEGIKEDVTEVTALPEKDPNDTTTAEEIQKSVRELVFGTAKGAVKEAVDQMKSEFKTWIENQQEAMTKKAGIYHPSVVEKREKTNTFFRDFVKSVLDNDVSAIEKIANISRKELTTDATGSPYGGYTVGKELSAEIRHLITEYGVARREMSTLQLSRNEYDANTLVTDVTVYWVDEAAAIKSTQVVLGQKALTLKKLGAIVTLTRELLEDSEIDIFRFVAERVAEGFAKAEDQAAFIGDGTSTYGSQTGILAVAGTNSVVMASTKTAFTDLTADNLLDAQDATPQGALGNAKYYMHRSIRSIVRKLKDSQGQYIYEGPTSTGPGTLWGKPVVEVEVMPAKGATAVSKAFVAFADLKKSSIFGYKGAISADRFNAGVVRNVADNADINLITTDREAVRWVERVGVIHVLPTAITKIVTAAS